MKPARLETADVRFAHPLGINISVRSALPVSPKASAIIPAVIIGTAFAQSSSRWKSERTRNPILIVAAVDSFCMDTRARRLRRCASTVASSPPSRRGRIVRTAHRTWCCVAPRTTGSKPCFARGATACGAELPHLLEMDAHTFYFPQVRVGLASTEDCRRATPRTPLFQNSAKQAEGIRSSGRFA